MRDGPVDSVAEQPPASLGAKGPELPLIRLPVPANKLAACALAHDFETSSSGRATSLSSNSERVNRDVAATGAAAAARAGRPSSKSQLMSLSMMHTP
jgi:hypothetical protein